MFSRAWNLRAASKIAAFSLTRSSACYSAMAPLTLYSWPTPNGIKASITLEELGIDYKIEPTNISTNIQKEEYAVIVIAQIRINLANSSSKMVPEDKPQRAHPRAPGRRSTRLRKRSYHAISCRQV
jgi:hypothetical protein